GPGTYFVCESSKTGWIQTYPNATTTDPANESIYNACNNINTNNQYGYKFTAASGVNLSGNDFGNTQQFRLIILTCSEPTQQLVVSTVTSDGTFGNADDRDTIAQAPALAGFSGTQADLQTYLCNLGDPSVNARYNNLQAGDYDRNTRIPKP